LSLTLVDTLYLRLQDVAPDAPTEYCLAGADARLSWDVRRAPLAEVLAEGRGRRVVVLVPTDDIRLEALPLPVKQASKAAQAARYALEDALADDVDDLHFAVGARDVDGSYPIAIVDRTRFEGWRRVLLEAGLQPQQMLPEGLLLPPPEGETWHALVEADRVSVRHQRWGLFSGAPEDLDTLLDLADSERGHRLRLLISGEATRDYTALPRPVELRSGFSSGLAALLPQLETARLINLLQGDYAPQSDYQRLWRPWRWPLALAATLLVLVGAELALSGARMAAEAEALQAANVERFRQLFPGETRIVDLAAQAEQQLTLARQQDGGGGVLNLLSSLNAGLSGVEGLTLQGVQYREQALFVSLSGSSLQQLEALQQRFGERPEVRLEVQSANAGSDGVQIRLKLSPA
jgi:general secretion pathway protein L